MTAMRVRQVLWGTAMAMLLVRGHGCAHSYDAKEVEGTWQCSISWTWDRDGEAVPCGMEWQATCKDRRLSSEGVLSLGEAQWDETIEGTCDVQGQDLVGTRSSVKTVPRNDAARRFEEERLEGRSLSHEQPDPQAQFRSRITSFTGNELVAVNGEGRTYICKRL